MKQINLSNLDLSLCDLTVGNEKQEGLLDALEMILDEIIDPIERTNNPSHEQRVMVLYGVVRNKKAIKALTSCLRESTKMQSTELSKLYSQCFETNSSTKKDGAN